MLLLFFGSWATQDRGSVAQSRGRGWCHVADHMSLERPGQYMGPGLSCADSRAEQQSCQYEQNNSEQTAELCTAAVQCPSLLSLSIVLRFRDNNHH